MSSVTPGRETDALVAEKLGWSDRVMVRRNLKSDPVIAFRKWPEARGDLWVCPEYGVWRDEAGAKIERGKIAFCAHYSTSPTDAIATLEATGKDYTIVKDGDRYGCMVWRDESHAAEGDEFNFAPTLCAAICAAILQLRGEG